MYQSTLQYRVGQGIVSSSNQLINRLKLLGGSLMAGNNGVVPEFIQITKYLNSIGVLPTNELRKMMHENSSTISKLIINGFESIKKTSKR